jgi:enamine deaminase RidA (YjgF/YER057c/UK114 family)
VGYSRVVRAGELAWVAGSTAMVNGELVGEGDAFRQTIEAFGVAAVALESVGMSLQDAVRTRMSIVDRALARDVCRAHFEIFDAIRPVSTLVVVAGLVDERMLVEVEVDACRPESAPGSRRHPGRGAGPPRRDRT